MFQYLDKFNPNPNYTSVHSSLANQTVYWLPMDTEERYNENLKKNSEQLAKFNWIGKSFTYEFNSLGFRCDEFNQDPSIVFLGPSSTLGTGLPLTMAYPHIVSEHLNLRCVNLGQRGGSADTAFRLLHGYIDKINPKIVVHMDQSGTRFEILNDITFLIFSHSSNEEVYKLWATDKIITTLMFKKISLL